MGGDKGGTAPSGTSHRDTNLQSTSQGVEGGLGGRGRGRSGDCPLGDLGGRE